MEITPFALTRLVLGSKIQFFENIIGVIDSNNATVLKVEPLYTALLHSWQGLSALYITDQKNPLSQEIADLDSRRDEGIMSLWLQVDGHSHSLIPANRLAGQKLLRNLSLYANSPSDFAKQRYDLESTNITNVLTGWNTETELMAARDLLNLSEETTALSEVNSQLNLKVFGRNEVYAAETTDTSKQKQAEASTAYYDLCKALNSLAYVTPAPMYDKTIREINAFIDSADLSLRQKAGRKKEKSPEAKVSPN